MKFFDKTILKRIHLGMESEEDNKNWDKQCNQKGKAFLKARNRLPQNIIDICEESFFHDAMIEDIIVHKRVKKMRYEDRLSFDVIIKMELFYPEVRGMLIHKDVSTFKTGITFNCTDFDYLYGEIYLSQKKELIHNILTSDHDEIHIKCRSMIWEEEVSLNSN